jgi:hypothetical protein
MNLEQMKFAKDFSMDMLDMVALVPPGSVIEVHNLVRKIQLNSISLDYSSDSASGVFIYSSRFNHDCIGNSDYYFFEDDGVMIVTASRDIATGEEITFSYVEKKPNECDRRVPS